MSDTERPTLQVVDDEFVDPAEPEAEPAPPAPQKQGVSIGEIVEGYADLIRSIRTNNKNVTEGGLIKLIEIAVNSHFTSLQLGQQLQQLQALAAARQEESNGNDREA